MSHCGASSAGWYHAITKPLRTTTGYVRSRAFLFVRWLYGTLVHAPVPSYFQPWKGHASSLPDTVPP